MSNEKGFTLTELLAVVVFLVVLTGVAGLVYIGIHFLLKVW